MEKCLVSDSITGDILSWQADSDFSPCCSCQASPLHLKPAVPRIVIPHTAMPHTTLPHTALPRTAVPHMLH